MYEYVLQQIRTLGGYFFWAGCGKLNPAVIVNPHTSRQECIRSHRTETRLVQGCRAGAISAQDSWQGPRSHGQGIDGVLCAKSARCEGWLKPPAAVWAQGCNMVTIYTFKMCRLKPELSELTSSHSAQDQSPQPWAQPRRGTSSYLLRHAPTCTCTPAKNTF